jgi:hypothetical protein
MLAFIWILEGQGCEGSESQYFLCILCIHFLRKKIHFLHIVNQFFEKKGNINPGGNCVANR